MREVGGDLWEWHRAGHVVAITTGGLVDRRGACVMLRGCARQARDRHPWLPALLGSRIRAAGNRVFDLGRGLVSFPVEEDPFSPSDLRLIARSCRELVALADSRRWPRVVLPRPGCGAGGLAWGEVRPLLEHVFDHRFLVLGGDQAG